MSNPGATPCFLGIPPELRECIFKHCLPSGGNLYKLPFEHKVATNYIPLVVDVTTSVFYVTNYILLIPGVESCRLQEVNISAFLTLNKLIYFEVLSILSKTMNVHINRFDQLRRAVYGYESGLSGQLRQLTVHGDTRLGLHRLRDHSIINVSDWENLRFLSLAADDFEDMFTTLTPTRDMIGRGSRTVGRPAVSNARGSPPLYIGTRRSDSSRPVDTVAIMCQLIDQLLSYNNGCLRIQGRSFLGTFQVYGKKGQKTPLQVDKFIPALRRKCATTAKSGKSFQAPVEEMIGEVKVSIGYTRGGITTARIL